MSLCLFNKGFWFLSGKDSIGSSLFCSIRPGVSSAVLRQPGGVQVGHGACLDLKHLSLDVVAGNLLAGLADGDGLAALAPDVNGLAVFPPAGWPLRALRLHRLQVLHCLFAQSDDVHLLRLVGHLGLEHVHGLNVGALLHHTALSHQSHVS